MCLFLVHLMFHKGIFLCCNIMSVKSNAHVMTKIMRFTKIFRPSLMKKVNGEPFTSKIKRSSTINHLQDRN